MPYQSTAGEQARPYSKESIVHTIELLKKLFPQCAGLDTLVAAVDRFPLDHLPLKPSTTFRALAAVLAVPMLSADLQSRRPAVWVAGCQHGKRAGPARQQARRARPAEV